jgi:hypothetical protein
MPLLTELGMFCDFAFYIYAAPTVLWLGHFAFGFRLRFPSAIRAPRVIRG